MTTRSETKGRGPKPGDPKKRRTQAAHDREEEIRDAIHHEQQRPSAEELGGESEYSLESAEHDERGASRRVTRGEYGTEDPGPTGNPIDLARRFLEGATEARHEDDEGEEPVRVPLEQE